MSNPAHELPTRLHDAAAGIANARGGRRGVPAIGNILEILPAKLYREVVEDAQAALDAAAAADPVQPPPHRSRNVEKLARIHLCKSTGEALGAQATVLLDIASDGVVTVSTWARNPGTPSRAIAEWGRGLWSHAISAVPFRTIFGFGTAGTPTPLTPEERASLGEADRAYADRNSQEPTS